MSHKRRPKFMLPLVALSVLAVADCSPEPAAEPPLASKQQALTLTLTDCPGHQRSSRRLPARIAATGPSTITLMGGCTYSLVARNNFYYGPNGLPAITNDITIDGTSQGAIIERSAAGATPTFRLFSLLALACHRKSGTAGAAKPDACVAALHKAEAAARQW